MKIPNRHYTGGRETTIGGSDAAAILGLSRWRSPFDVWFGKTQEGGMKEIDSPAVYWGNRAEKIIADHYGESRGLRLMESPVRVRTDLEWFSGTPDRLILGDEVVDPVTGAGIVRRGLEIKTTSSRYRRKWASGGQIVPSNPETAGRYVPVDYWIQCQWYMHLMDFPDWDLVVKIDSADYREFIVPRAYQFLEHAIGVCSEFHKNYMVTHQPPPIDWGRDWNRYFGRLFSEDQGVRDLTDQEESLARRYKRLGYLSRDVIQRKQDLQDRIAHLEEQLDLTSESLDKISKRRSWIANHLRSDLGGYRTGIGKKIKVDYKDTSNGRRLNVRKVQNETEI